VKIVKDDDVKKILEAPMPGPSPRPGPTARVLGVEARGFFFEMESCGHRGGAVVCRVLVTNRSEDRDLTICNAREDASRLIDDSGVQYPSSSEPSLGSAVGRISKARLPSGVPIRATLRFTGVPESARLARLVEVVCDSPQGSRIGLFAACEGSNRFTVQFRDVPVQPEGGG
jgi:hypothetical protein